MNLDSDRRRFFLRSRRQNALLVLSCLATLGTYFIIPFLTIYLVRDGGLSAALAGAVLASYLVSSRALMFLAGVISDRFGARLTMAVGLGLTGASYAGLVLANSFIQYCGVMIISGIGVALFQPSSKSLFVHGTPEEEMSIAFAWRGAAANAGVAVGGVLGSASLGYLSFDDLFLAAAALYAAMVVFVGLFRFTEPVPVTAGSRMWVSLKSALTDGDLLLMLVLSAGFWVLYTQLSVTVPLALNGAGLAQAMGFVFAFNAALIVLFQVPLSSTATHRFGIPPEHQFSLGVLAIGVGLACLSFIALGWPALVSFVLFFTLGEMLAVPNLDAIPALLARGDHVGTYLGVGATGGAIGSGIGAAAGGTVLGVGESAGAPGLVWVLCATLAVFLAAGIGLLLQVGRRASRKRD